VKEKGVTIAVIAAVIVVILIAVAGIGVYFLIKSEPEGGAPPEGEGEEGEGVERTSSIPLFMIEEDFDKGNDIASLTSEDLRELNVKIARTHVGGPFVWDLIEPRKGEFDFTMTDNVVNEAFDSGISILASLWPYALWDQENKEEYRVAEEYTRENCPLFEKIPDYRGKPQDMEAYKHFLRELVERYDGDDNFGSYPIDNSLKDKIRQNPIIYWEINNEVDLPDVFFVGTLEDYFDLLKNSYEAIKEACENCQVVIGAPAGSIRDYYSTLLSLGARNYFDIYNLHVRLVQYIQDLEETVGTLNKPVFATETAVSKFFGTDAAEGAKMAILMAAAGYSSIGTSMAPSWVKYNTSSIGGDPEKEEEFFKECLLFENGSKTPYYYALKTLATKLENFTSVENMGEGRYKFIVDNKPVYVLWGMGSLPSEITGTVKMTDISGNEEQKQAPEITLSNSPIFIEPVE